MELMIDEKKISMEEHESERVWRKGSGRKGDMKEGAWKKGKGWKTEKTKMDEGEERKRKIGNRK